MTPTAGALLRWVEWSRATLEAHGIDSQVGALVRPEGGDALRLRHGGILATYVILPRRPVMTELIVEDEATSTTFLHEIAAPAGAKDIERALNRIVSDLRGGRYEEMRHALPKPPSVMRRMLDHRAGPRQPRNQDMLAIALTCPIFMAVLSVNPFLALGCWGAVALLATAAMQVIV